MARIGIIQVSDTQFGPNHVFNPPNTIAPRLTSDILQCAAKFSFVPTYLICSGDIAETGTAKQFKVAGEQIRSIAAGISVDTSNVFFVPGNHDVNRQLAELVDIGDDRLKLQCYDKFCREFSGNDRNLDFEMFQTEIDYRLGICFVMINSCEKEDHETHIGSVSIEKLVRTMQCREVSLAKSQNFLNVAVVHHRLDTDAGEARSMIDNAGDVCAILASNGFQIALTGHVHSQVTQSFTQNNHTIVFSGCGSAGVDKSQRPEGVPNQYSVHVVDNASPSPTFESYFRAYNPNRRTEYGLGGWSRDTTYDVDPQTFTISWNPSRQFSQNVFVEDTQLKNTIGIHKNPFTVSNAEKFSDEVVLQLFVQDEERHRAALRLTGDAIIRGPRGSGKTMCLKYLNVFGSMDFVKSVEQRRTAECFPVLINLGQLHVADREPIEKVYEAAERLILEQTINALDQAVDIVLSTEFKAAVYRTKQRYAILANQSGSQIAHLGVAIRECLMQYFDHVLLLIDEIANVFPKVFFANAERGFGKWMNTIRNSGPYNTRICVYPNDVADTLNEERFGNVVNLNFDPRVAEQLVGFRRYARKLCDVYLKSVAVDESNPPEIGALIACSDDENDPLEQLLYASAGSSRRLIRLFEKALGIRCRRERETRLLSKDDVFELIAAYSGTLVASYTDKEQQLAASIAKSCKRASTFRFKLPGLSDSMRRLCLSREETNIASIVEFGTGTRATTYEFNFPYCVQESIPTHHVKDTARINHGRDTVLGEWIQKITNIEKSDLDVFKEEGRVSGTVAEVVEGLILIVDENNGEYYADETDLDLKGGEIVSFIAIDQAAEDLMLAE